ncbi:MAG: hypothetical protein J7502_07540 [Flavisolibacter sp.]|nr:hypothetical protein [Flavisolibacter sp.]
MKLLMLSAFCVLSFCVFAQLPDNKNPQLQDTLKNFKGNNSDILHKQQDYLQRKKAPHNLLANKHGNVVLLPQDKMPCIVPDTSGLAKIPNAWGATTVPYVPQFHSIPNPALPRQQSFELKIPDNSLDSQTK